MKIIILNLFFLAGLFISPVIGQMQYQIDVISPPANLPPCTQQLETQTVNGQSKTLFSVLLPSSLKLSFGGIPFNVQNGNYVFTFEASSAVCEVNANGYLIKIIGGGQSVIVGGQAPLPTPAPTPVGIATSPDFTAEETTKNAKNDEKAQELDFSIPESPGFTILGVTPQEVTRPSTPREFATALINSVDKNGNFQTGIAIDVAPYQLFFGDSVNRDRDYIPFQDGVASEKKKRETLKGYFTRFLWRTQFSLATIKGTTDSDKSARLGSGLNLTFLDYGDPNTDFLLRDCNKGVNIELEDKAAQDLGFRDRLDPGIGQDDVKNINARKRFLITQGFMIEKYEKCAADSEKRNFGKTSLGVGVAGSWISKNGQSSKFINNGQGLWASLAYGFEGVPGFRCTDAEIEDENNRCITPQLIFHFRRRVKETVPDPLQTGMFTTKDSNLFGTRLRIGVPKWAVNFEGVYHAERYAGRSSSQNISATFGADYRLASNLYLNFSVGGETKESNIPGTGKVFVRTSFNWGTSQKPLKN